MLSDASTVFKQPQHPYTQGLLRAVPNIQLDDMEELYQMGGAPPDLITPPKGCRFHPRCPQAMPVCAHEEPHFQQTEKGHWVHCWLHEEIPAEYQTQEETGA